MLERVKSWLRSKYFGYEPLQPEAGRRKSTLWTWKLPSLVLLLLLFIPLIVVLFGYTKNGESPSPLLLKSPSPTETRSSASAAGQTKSQISFP
jgi:uncharacterized protein YpmS